METQILEEIDSKEKMRKIIDFLNYHTKLYDMGKPEISDELWDKYYFELKRMEDIMSFSFADSPTQKISYDVVNKLSKVEHSHPMLSLDKTKSINEIKGFISNKKYIAMPKYDGLTCSLTYRNGKLVSAETRGNGIIGEDILHNAIHISNLPNTISYKEELVIDGEIICKEKDFEQFANEYKNPRNFASGSIRLLDSNESSTRKLSFIAWDKIGGDEPTLDYKLVELSVWGFETGIWYTKGDIEQIVDAIKKSSKELGYPIDGVVFKYNDCKEYENAGKTDHHFKGGLAYKFYDEEYETVLKDIEWTMGRTGQLTPVAVYEDVDIDGTICNRASLHNLTIIKETLGKYGWKNQKIKIFKANQIIPQISWAEPENEYTKEYFNYPMICPICGQPTEIKKDNDSEVLYCGNPECEGKVLNRLDHFCSKKGLDIKGLSKATLEKLMDWSWINDYYDIFTLKSYREEWIKKQGFGILSVDNILKAIEESKNTTLDKIIAAAGIPEIGSKVAKDLARHYDSWTDFRAETSFIQYDGIGEIMNDNLLSFDYNDLRLDKTINDFLIIKKEEINNSSKKLENLTFCITGKVTLFRNRTELQNFIESNGGKAASSVTKNVNYLINNDVNSTSSKNIRAKELGIKIIDEQTFLDMFDFQK